MVKAGGTSLPAQLVSRRAVPVWGYAVALAAAIVAGNHVVFSGVIDGSLSVNHFTPLTWVDAPLMVGLTIAIAVIVTLLSAGLGLAEARTAEGTAAQMPRKRALLLWLLLSVLLFVAWLPYILTYAPGSVMSDSLYSIAGDRTNHHPIVFTLIVHSFARLGTASGDINRGILAYTVLQALVMALGLAGGVVWALRRGAPRAWGAVATVYFALLPVFPIYAMNVQKDPLFSLFVAALGVVLFRVADTDGQWLRSGRGIAAFLLVSTLVLFFRNNGVLVVLGSALAVALFYPRRNTAFFASVAALLVVTFLIQGPGYDALGVRRNTFVESIGILLQQVGYVASSGGEVTAEQQEFLSGMLPYDQWRQAYAPCLVDTLKWNPAFNGQYLNANRPAFLRTWAELLRENPRAYMNAYGLATLGFWDVRTTNQYGFADTKVVPNDLGVAPTDLIEVLTGTSIKPTLDATRGDDGASGFLPSGTLIWLVLLAGVLLATRGHTRYALALAPCFFLWTSVMIAAPVAFSLRYVFAIVICLPGILLLPFVTERVGSGALVGGRTSH